MRTIRGWRWGWSDVARFVCASTDLQELRMRWPVRSIASIVLVAGFSLVWTTSPRVQAQKTKNSVPAQFHRAVVIEFIKFIRNSEHTFAQYGVNFGAEPVRYPGFAVNSNCMILIRQDVLIKAPPSIWGTHLFGTYSLMPGKTFVYDVQIPNEEEQFEIGFAC